MILRPPFPLLPLWLLVVLQVVQSYIKCMVDSVEVVVHSDHTVDDPLDDDGSLKGKDGFPPLPAASLADLPSRLSPCLFCDDRATRAPARHLPFPGT